MLDTPRFALEKIREAQRQGHTELDLQVDWNPKSNRLAAFPPEILELKSLEVLNLNGNQILSVPDSISQLQHLTSLSLANTGITHLPKGISYLQNLESLNLSGNALEEFPEFISELRNLSLLNLKDMKLTTLPESIGKLQKLAELNLSGNDFKSLPQSIISLQNLVNLNLSFNGLATLPESIAGLQNLTTLRLSGNYSLTLPHSISELTKLTTLDLSQIGLSTLPEALIKLQNLISLMLNGNQFTSFPEIITDFPSLASLNLAGMNFNSLPNSFSKLQTLTSLDLSVNPMKELPAPVCRLQRLTSLLLSGTKIITLPDSLINLQNLTYLDMNSISLESMPEPITKLQNLNYLNLAINQLSDLPNSIAELTKLNELILGGNRFQTIPDCVFQLSNLSTLWLYSNLLTDLPASITRLKNLKELGLGANRLTVIPEAIYELTSLERLELDNVTDEGNQIREVSPKILQLENLISMNLKGNPVEVPPAELVEQGIVAIKGYFRQLKAEGEDYLYEAKLLIVGEGGAGKTSLANKIRDSKYQLKEEDSTKGIEVLPWMFPMKDGKSFRVNIWDFGGQEIYHATHQFFLTKRSLYVLVADTRKEDTDFYYWLNAVELFSDNSPLLIVKNEKQDRRREINERHLRGQFSNLKETLATNLATNRGLEKISDEVKHYVSGLPQVGAPLPKTWVKVREALEKDSRNYISLEQYLDICEKNGFSKQKDKIQLIGYLHDLGVCLYFQEDPLLKKTIILKPRWGTDAVYKVLDNKEVITNLGKFRREDLTKIWHEPEYTGMQDELLQLMINFKLCYRIPNSELYIAPQLLTENQPGYEWDESNNLILRYKYDSFMPKGMLTQFIVAMNRSIAGQKLVWKSGVVLEKGHTTAEVVEYYGKREIKIRVAGKDRKELLTIVMYELDTIHESYKRLKYSKFIPCNCEVCRNSQDPHFYAFEVLKRFIGDKQQIIQCEKSYQMIDVMALIDDVGTMKQIVDATSRTSRDFIFQGTVENLVIQHSERGTNIVAGEERKIQNVKSAWANGSFYLFTFAVVIAGLGVLARTVPAYALAGILVAGVIFVPMIGALQLKQDDRLSEKSFMDLMKMVVGQLPLIGKVFGTYPNES